ncbi:MAG: 4Fe-4S binding protein [Planctomycetota bacterium]|nr:4Fe-4S binding protein [Planctomycetota bacterium]
MRFDLFAPFRPLVRRGVIARIVGRLFPSWLHSPLRRTVQGTALIVFTLLVFWVSWPHDAKPGVVRDGWPATYAANRESKEIVNADAFLALDPLVSTTAALATRAWVWSLAWAGVLLVVSLLAPRGFCGWLCPLGTLCDISDRILARPRIKQDGGWIHTKYYILLVVAVASMFGVLLSGFVAAIPLVTRGLAFSVRPLHVGLILGWREVPPLATSHILAIGLLTAVLAVGVLRPRFWCRHLCPTGALLSIVSTLRLVERKVGPSCTGCGTCVKACSFGAIRPDFKTRTAECTFCQSCGGACPVRAISFAPRWSGIEGKPADINAAEGGALSRRALIGTSVAAMGAALAMPKAGSGATVIRPPGSVGEEDFLALCVRCGACMNACPTSLLQPEGFGSGVLRLWTPRAATTQAGCDPSCNNCGFMCPTGAIRALPLAEKRYVRMGLATVDRQTCLPHAGIKACQLCADVCRDIGYNAIVMDAKADDGRSPADTSFEAPIVDSSKCVGCGYCESQCQDVNVTAGDLAAPAIRVTAGPGREDRIRSGSYRALHTQRAASPASGAATEPAAAGRHAER